MADDAARIQHLNNRMEQLTFNLHHLELQATKHGGESNAPLFIINQLRDTRLLLEQIRNELRELGVDVETGPSLLQPTSVSATPQGSQPANTTKQAVILLHGIRTQGDWQHMVREELQNSNIKVIPIGYGFFNAFRFWCPVFTRDGALKRILREIRTVQKRHPGYKLSFITHSFGTYAIARILKEETDIKVFRLILCGSIISSDYRWDELRDSIEECPINDCGRDDIWPILAQSTSWGYGATGTFGFKTAAAGIEDRFHDYTHSQYFEQEFVEKYWKPYIHEGMIIPGPDAGKMRTTPLWKSILSILPIKYIILLIIIAILYFFIYKTSFVGDGTPTPQSTNISKTQLQMELDNCDQFIDKDKIDLAIKSCSLVITYGQTPSYIAYYRRGEAYRKSDQCSEAISDYNMAEGLSGNNEEKSSVYYSRGFCYRDSLETKNLDLAVQDFTSAIDRNPSFLVDIYFERAYTFELRGDIQESIQDYQSCMQKSDKESDIYSKCALRLSALYDMSTTPSNQTSDNNECNNPKGHVYFTSFRDGGNEIYKMNPDGSGVVQLTQNADDDNLPRISPDGARIVFVSNRNNGENQLYLMNVDGTDVIQLTTNHGDDPAWSPDGTKIAFASSQDGDTEIYILDLLTKTLTQITLNNHDDNRPWWSPDGTKIVYDTRPNNTDWGIHIVNIDGTNDTQIHTAPADSTPVWSPDGTTILFSSKLHGNIEVYTIATDGSNLRRLTENDTRDVDGVWSLDGECIIFESSRSQNMDLWVMTKDGKNLKNITNNPANDYFASWGK